MDFDSSFRARPIRFAIALTLAVMILGACGSSARTPLPAPTITQTESASASAATSRATAEPAPTAPSSPSLQAKTLAPTLSPVTQAPTARPATLAPTVAPEQAQPQNLCGAPANPWAYNFCGGSVITSPAATFCNFFNCIANFWNGRGYVMECSDTTFGKSGGISGSCSSHGGNFRALRAP